MPRLTAKSAAQIETAPPTKVIAAYELLLQGRYHLKRREEGPIRRSIELFEQAIALDPGFGEAYRELARAYALLPYYSYRGPRGDVRAGGRHDRARHGRRPHTAGFRSRTCSRSCTWAGGNGSRLNWACDRR